jgi:hypothetical protein
MPMLKGPGYASIFKCCLVLFNPSTTIRKVVAGVVHGCSMMKDSIVETLGCCNSYL